MRYRELLLERKGVSGLSPDERHRYAHFIYKWLFGYYMDNDGSPALAEWEEISRLFPPKIKAPVTLYRLVTLPIGYAKEKSFRFRPAPGPVSSWTAALKGLDNISGMVMDSRLEKDARNTTRLAISTTIDPTAILATHRTMRDAFRALTSDFWDRYPDDEDGNPNPNFPEYSDLHFEMNDVGGIHDALTNQKGGYGDQYEVVVRTPALVDAKVVRLYRVGSKHLRAVNRPVYW